MSSANGDSEQRRSGSYDGIGGLSSPDSTTREVPRSGGKSSNRRASVVFRRDEDKQLDALRGQDVEIEADSAAFRALETDTDGKNTKAHMFPSSNKKKKSYFSSLFVGGGGKDDEDEEEYDDDEDGHPSMVEGRKNVQDAGNYMLTIGMVYGIRTMTGRRDFFHALLEHNSYFYDTDSDESDFNSDDSFDSGNDDDSYEEERRRRRKIKQSHKKFSDGLKSLFGFSKSKRTDGGPKIVRKRYKNSNSGVSYAYTYKRGDSPRKPPIINDDESQNSNEEKVEITEEDFTYEIEVTFPPEGSPGPPFPTPEHKLPQAFKFKDYMPNAFRAVRHLSGISEVEYIQSVANPNLNYIEFLANSKSGQFFFYSHDRKYMIKTMTKTESQYLRKIFPEYLRHLNNNPDSLIVRFYGMHRVKMRFLDSRIYFVIMSSVFDTDLPIHHKYDVKGSSIGRHVPRKLCRESSDVVKKDLNLVEDCKTMILGREGSRRLQEVMKADSRFLRKLNIMDYSLLIGIHEGDPPRGVGGLGNDGQQQYSDEEDIYAENEDDNSAVKPYFRKCKNGFKGELKEDGSRDIYYLGIIDILTLYSFTKKAETVLKSLTGVDVRELSSVDPDWYAERFNKFVLHHTDYELFYGKKIKERERLRKDRLLRQSEGGYDSDDGMGGRNSKLRNSTGGGGGSASSKFKQAGKGVIASNRMASPSSKSPSSNKSNNSSSNNNNSPRGSAGGGSNNNSNSNNSNNSSSARRTGIGSNNNNNDYINSGPNNSRFGSSGGGNMGSNRDDGGFGYYPGNSFTPMANSNLGARSPLNSSSSSRQQQQQFEQESFMNNPNSMEARGVQPSQDFVPIRSGPSPNVNVNQQPRSNSAGRGQQGGGGISEFRKVGLAVVAQQNMGSVRQQQQQESFNPTPTSSNADMPPPRARPGNKRQPPMAPPQGQQGGTQMMNQMMNQNPNGSSNKRRDDML